MLVKTVSFVYSQAELALSLQEAQYKEQQLDLTNGSLKRQLLQIKEEKEEREKEAVSWFNALGVSRLWMDGWMDIDSYNYI